MGRIPCIASPAWSALLRASALLLASAVLLAFAAHAQHDDPAARLAGALAAGRWNATAADAYADLALRTARVDCAERVPAEFWTWLDDTPKVRSVVAWATAEDPGPKFFQCLERLRSEHAADVRDLPHLAVGFAFAWSGGADDVPRRRQASWTDGRAPIPSMSASFAWYAEHPRRLPFRVDRACWKVLAYTALNDVPFDEREWVLARYRNRDVSELHGLFAEVPYIADGLDGKPRTLANMVEFGGVCTVNTQFHMAVMRTLGVPATFGGGPGHCWPCWIEADGRTVSFRRANDLGNADGTLGEPGIDAHRYESDLRMLADALSTGAARLRDADLSGAALDRLGAQAPPGAARALIEALRKNPHSRRGWRALGASIRADRIAKRHAATALRLAAEMLDAHPRATLRLLPALLPPAPGAHPRPASIADALEVVRRRIGDVANSPRDVRRLAIEFFEAAQDLAPDAAGLRLRLLLEAPEPVAFDAPDGLGRTRAVGGSGGAEFEDIGGAQACIVGFRFTTTDYFGHEVLGSIQPLYEGDGRAFAGRTLGRRSGESREVVVPDGHVLVGVEARGGDRFDGFRLVSAAVEHDGAVDMNSVYFGPWCGGRGDGWGTLLGAPPHRVVGVHGRSGDAIDALGLVVEPPADPEANPR